MATRRRLYQTLRPKLQQYQATTGRQIDASAMRAILDADLDAGRSDDRLNAQIALRQRSLDLQAERMDDRDKAALASGKVQALGAAVQGGMLLKHGLAKKKTTTPAVTSPTAASAGAQTGMSVGAPAGAGAQTGMSVGQPAVSSGVQTGMSVGAPAAVGSAPPTAASVISTMGSKLAGVAVPGLQAAAGIGIGSSIGEKLLPGRGSTGARLGGAAGGAAVGGYLAAGTAIGGPIGAVAGAIVGAITGDSVVCTELERQGYMPTGMRLMAGMYASEHVPQEAYVGYRLLFDPVVAKMKTSKFVTYLVKPFGMAWAHEMAHRMRPKRYKGSWLGKVILKVGVPVCSAWYEYRVCGGYHGIS